MLARRRAFTPPTPARISTAKSSGRALFDSALSAAEIDRLHGFDLSADLRAGLVGDWDFSREVATAKAVDLSGNGHDGVVVNLPARAITGHRWDRRGVDWPRRTEQYGAIHFHDDDLVDARWHPDFAFEVPDGLRSGVYAARLASEASTLGAVLRPSGAARPSEDRLPGIDRDLYGLHQRSRPLRLARHRALPRPAHPIERSTTCC